MGIASMRRAPLDVTHRFESHRSVGPVPPGESPPLRQATGRRGQPERRRCWRGIDTRREWVPWARSISVAAPPREL
jgi:hypothetical protein